MLIGRNQFCLINDNIHFKYFHIVYVLLINIHGYIFILHILQIPQIKSNGSKTRDEILNETNRKKIIQSLQVGGFNYSLLKLECR